MRKIAFIYTLLVFLAACDKMDISREQADSFIKFYNTFPIFAGADVKEIPGRGYAAIGTVTSYTAGKQICLIRTDVYGNWVDSARYFGRELDDEAFCLQVLEDHDLAILGSSINPETEKKEVFFIRTDSTGNVIWTKFIKGTGDVVASDFEVNPAGNFIMTGYGDTLKPGGGINKDIWLFALDANGHNIADWPRPRYYGGLKDDIGTHLQITANNSYVITGQTRSDPSELKYSHAFVLLTNSIGKGGILNTIASTADEVGNCIRMSGVNSYIVMGITKNATAGSGWNIMLKKVTISGTLKTDWEKTYGGNGDDFGKSLILDGNFLQLLVTTSSASINSSIGLITTDLDGNDAIYSYFGKGIQLSASAFAKTSDNGFIITGTNIYSENEMSMALIKVKADGSL